MSKFLSSMGDLAALLIASFSLAGSAIAADLTGKWVRDGAQSDQVPNPMYWTTRGVDAGGRGANSTIEVVIKHDGDKLQIAETNVPLRVLTVDGRPHEMATDTGLQRASVTAATRGEAVIVDWVQPYGGLPGNVALATHQTFQLSPDGATLVVVTTRTTPARRESYTEVYRKQ